MPAIAGGGLPGVAGTGAGVIDAGIGFDPRGVEMNSIGIPPPWSLADAHADCDSGFRLCRPHDHSGGHAGARCAIGDCSVDSLDGRRKWIRDRVVALGPTDELGHWICGDGCHVDAELPGAPAARICGGRGIVCGSAGVRVVWWVPCRTICTWTGQRSVSWFSFSHHQPHGGRRLSAR